MRGAAALDVLAATDPDLAGFARDILTATGARISMVGGDLIDSGLAIPPGVLCLVMPTRGAADDDVEAMVQQQIADLAGAGWLGQPCRHHRARR